MKLSDKIRTSIMRIARASTALNRRPDDSDRSNDAVDTELADAQIQFEELMMSVDRNEDCMKKEKHVRVKHVNAPKKAKSKKGATK